MQAAYCMLSFALNQANSSFGYYAGSKQANGDAGDITVGLTLRVNTHDITTSKTIPVVCP